MFGFIAPALLAVFALYLTHYPFLWLLPPRFYLLEPSFQISTQLLEFVLQACRLRLPIRNLTYGGLEAW